MDEPRTITEGVVLLCIGISAAMTAIGKAIEAAITRWRNGRPSINSVDARLLREHSVTLARHGEALRNMGHRLARIDERVAKIHDHLLESKS